jgi:hypothetical protein
MDIAKSSSNNRNGSGINKLLAAAVVNKKFCDLLLTDPKAALRNGYNGESFQLREEDQRLVLSIQADSLADFAAHLVKLRQ